MDDRKLMRYAIFKVDPSWRHLPHEERTIQKKEMVGFFSSELPCEAFTYSLSGLRADAEILCWLIADSPEQLQRFQSGLVATALGKFLIPAYSYLAMSRKSQYVKGHKHEGQESAANPGPVGSTYLFVYPMDKQRAWYRLPFDERRRIMGEHLRIGHRYPGIKIHTGYSFGIDDQEFVVAFEGESVAEFLDLVEELRGSESSSYTTRDVPIFTCVKTPIEGLLDQLDGSSA